MHEPHAVGGERRAEPMHVVGVLVHGAVRVRVQVAVGLAACVAVGVGVEDAAVPPHEQSEREHHDDDPYRHFRGLATLSGRYWPSSTSGSPTTMSVVP